MQITEYRTTGFRVWWVPAANRPEGAETAAWVAETVPGGHPRYIETNARGETPTAALEALGELLAGAGAAALRAADLVP